MASLKSALQRDGIEIMIPASTSTPEIDLTPSARDVLSLKSSRRARSSFEEFTSPKKVWTETSREDCIASEPLLDPLLCQTLVPVGSALINVISCEEHRGRTHFHFAHGFGASSLSFERLMSYMCSATNLDVGVVCAHDIAGFGQSQPPRHHHEYTLQHDGCCVTPAVIEHALVRAGLPAGGGREAGIVFCGHSMGCISAVFSAVEWLERGHRTPSVLLVAPAIAASAGAAEACRFDLATRLWLRALFAALAWVRVVGALGAIAIRTMILGLVSLPRFWRGGLHVAFSFQSGLPTARTAAQYASAARRRNWTNGLLAFLDANVWRANVWCAGRQLPLPPTPLHVHASSVPQLLRRLHAAGARILIVHDEGDLLVPLANSHRLLAALPPGKASLETTRGSGHMPHETDVAAFTALLVKSGLLRELS